ncbi:FadR/GntR family transcriptional regulator [Gordonia humi]|nr:FCD domain-containing protein [Gordonia humi]
MAADIARQIENEVVADGWRVGTSVGSESAIMDRFGASRSVVREAFRILESRHVATPRRGPGGGLVVTAPDLSTVLDQASLYLEYSGFTADDLFQTMELLEIAAVEQVAATISRADLDGLRDTLTAEAEVDDLRFAPSTVYTELARLTDNPVLALFVDIGNNLSRTHGIRPSQSEQRWIHQHSVDLVDALAAGDALAAVRTVRRRIRGLRRRQSVTSTRHDSTGVQ